ncbi:uncharacterized protein LOC114270302 [Camellia sinensis]|uniref:uncharacterized protein LOC114270302 n=1 Tax=Camellia sinensis TaxID=4442 RepID=UPI001035CC56|nr:uncharacterized protein LOC114270302 [Camellia sinensis]
MANNVFTDAAVFGETNLELPIVVSNQSAVEPVGKHGFSIVEFGRPDLFILCNIDGKSQLDSCLFTQTGSNSKSQALVVWEIPCAIKEHSGVVSVVTFISAIVSAILIVVASIYYSDTQTFAVI